MEEAPLPREGVSLYGGEPLLRGDLLDLIQAARQKGFPRIRLRTNGSLLAQDHLLCQLLEAGCQHFEIKLFAADSRVHDHMTGQVGSLHQTWTGMELVQRTQIPGGEGEPAFLGIRIPLRLENAPYLLDTMVALMSLRPHRIVISWEVTEQSFAQMLPTLQKAINICLLNRTWILTENVPLCQMGGLEAHVAELYVRTVEGCEQVEPCRRCLYADFCPGLPSKYVKAQGSRDIKPVLESAHLEDIRGLAPGQDSGNQTTKGTKHTKDTPSSL
jgi:hypothetical protein